MPAFAIRELIAGPVSRKLGVMIASPMKLPLILLLGAFVALVLALGFAGWLLHTADLMLYLGEAGLSWCL